MTNRTPSETVQVAFDAVSRLQNAIRAVPQLQGSSLDAQLSATASLCLRLRQCLPLLSPHALDREVAILSSVSRSCQTVRDDISKAAHLTDWSLFRTGKRSMNEVAEFVQFQTSSVFIGVVYQARLVKYMSSCHMQGSATDETKNK